MTASVRNALAGGIAARKKFTSFCFTPAEKRGKLEGNDIFSGGTS